MLNKTQRNFRKQMEECKKEGKIPESYGPRFSGVEILRTHKTGFSIGGLSIIGIIIFCWNLFSLGTWINTIFHVNVFPTTSIGGYKNKQEVIHEYIQKNNETDKYIAASMQMVSNQFSRVNSYSLDTIKSQHKTLLTFKSSVETDRSNLQPLKNAYTNEFKTVEETLVFAENNYNKVLTPNDISYINNLFQQEKNMCAERRNILIGLLKEANMNYVVDANGTIHYQYKKTSFGY